MPDANQKVEWPLHLLSRKKEVDSYALENGNFIVRASLDDALPLQLGVFHPQKIFAEIELTPELVIARAQGEMTKHPYPECRDAISRLDRLVGIRVGPGVTSQVMKVAGGIRGCTHLTNLILDIVNLAVFAPGGKGQYFHFPGPVIPDEEMLKHSMATGAFPQDRCLAIHDGSPLVERVRASLGPASC